jgi:hypothetical protein
MFWKGFFLFKKWKLWERQKDMGEMDDFSKMAILGTFSKWK